MKGTTLASAGQGAACAREPCLVAKEFAMILHSFWFRGLAILSLFALAGCNTQGPRTPRLTDAPMCTIHAVTFGAAPAGGDGVDVALVSERAGPNPDPNTQAGFSRFRGIARPVGNPTLGFTPDVYGFSEAWTRNTRGSVVVRAQSHPARRGGTGPFSASAWTLHVQDATGTWSASSRALSAHRGTEVDTPAAGALMVPQLMPVGEATQQVFGCAGERSDDDVVRTTWLIEALVGNPALGTPAPPTIAFVQDLLSGDDRFVPNAPGILRGPANAPTPRINGRPGPPIREGSVKCAMTQLRDDVSTRELHMLAVNNGVLYHSMANNFSNAVSDAGAGSAFPRFNTVSTWGDVGSALGGGFGHILDAVIVARPQAVHVLFVAQQGSSYKLWHAVRFSANGGSWRPADDVLRLNGGHPSGAGFPFRIAAGLCPQQEDPQSTELVYTMWADAQDMIWSGRMVSTPRVWLPGLQGAYSPLYDLSRLMGRNADPAQRSTINRMEIGTRPFSDNARP
jgi:hypothetical protein